jgi:cell fate (sporulation/competence/biofilm development) regulator YlbF (YheA/YmcA/DUF963 family)
MADLALNDLEIAPPSVVLQAARDFGSALAATQQFQAFEKAELKLRTDPAAQRVIGAYQSKQQSLQMALMLNAASAEDRTELEQLRQAFHQEPAIAAHMKAQADVMALFKTASDLLSRHIGLSFTAACGPGCC